MRQDAPDTLPADFFSKTESAPDTLPADFFSAAPAPQAQATGAQVPFTPFRVTASPRDITSAVSKLTTGAYKYGGVPGSKEGTDCSGAMCVIGKQAGIDLPRTAQQQFNDKRGVPVKKGELQPGDLVFFGSPGPSGWHVGFYQGNGKFLHQSTDKAPNLSVGDLEKHAAKYGFRGAKRFSELNAKYGPKQAPVSSQLKASQSGLDIVKGAMQKPSVGANVPPANVPPSRTLRELVDRPKTVAKALETRKGKEGQRNVDIQSAIISAKNRDDANIPATGREGGPLESEVNPAGSRLVPTDETGPRKVLEQTLGDPYRSLQGKVLPGLQRGVGKIAVGLTGTQITDPEGQAELERRMGSLLGAPGSVEELVLNAALGAGVTLAGRFAKPLLQAYAKGGKAFDDALEALPIPAASKQKFADELTNGVTETLSRPIIPKTEPPTGLPPTVRPPKAKAAGYTSPDTNYDPKYAIDNPRVKADGYGRGTQFEVPEPDGDMVTVYRAAPLSETEIKPGQYVTASKAYAEDHLNMHTTGRLVENPELAKGGHILEAKVPKKDLQVLASNELSWVPRPPKETPKAVEPNDPFAKFTEAVESSNAAKQRAKEAIDSGALKVGGVYEGKLKGGGTAKVRVTAIGDGENPYNVVAVESLDGKTKKFMDPADAVEIFGIKPKAPQNPAGAKPTQTPPVKGKEPWEMTRDKLHDLRMRSRTHLNTIGTDDYKREMEFQFGTTTDFHKASVESALKEGKPVPAEVLADYPDLAKKYEKPAPPKVEEPKGVTPLAAGINPVDIIKRADDLNVPGFTVNRKPKDWSLGRDLRTPLSIVDGEGNVLYEGSYSRLAGGKGAGASKVIRDTEQAVTQANIANNRAIDVIKHLLGNAKGKTNETYDKFIDLVERDFTDPVRQGVTGKLKEALDLHDDLTERWRKYIIDSRRSLGLDMPDDWGITEKGYFRHLFLGDFVVKDGATRIGNARTYAEAQKIALDYLEKNPGANLTAQARDMSFGDPTVRLSNRKYWKTVGELSDSVGLSKEDIMEDIRGIVGRKGAKQKFLGALIKRTGAGGYSKAYEEVMRIHAAQLVRSQELSKLNKALAPVIEDIAQGRGTPGGVKLPGVADALQDHLDSLWGVPTKTEKKIGAAIENTPVLRNFVASPTMAARTIARKLATFQSVMKLHLGVRAPIVNALQPFTTLWPYIKTKDFAKLYGDYLKPETRAMLRQKGVLDSTSKLESGSIIAGKNSKKTPFAAASDLNRGVGYLFGYRGAIAKGLSEEAAHKSGLAWAEKVEFDNSLWNAPPILRSPGGRVFGQFKGFTVKNLEHIFEIGKMRQGDTKLSRAARVLKFTSALGAQGGVSAFTLGVKAVSAATIVNVVKDALIANGMEAKDAEQYATAAAYGAPALLGTNISGSVTVLDEPFGDSWQEKLVNFAGGPTLSMGGNLIQEAVSNKPIGEKVVRMGKSVTPAVKQADAVQQFIQSGPNGVKVRVGKDEWVTLSPQEAMLMALGFQPVKVSKYYDDKEIKAKASQSKVPTGAKPPSTKTSLPAGAKPVG